MSSTVRHRDTAGSSSKVSHADKSPVARSIARSDSRSWCSLKTKFVIAGLVWSGFWLTWFGLQIGKSAPKVKKAASARDVKDWLLNRSSASTCAKLQLDSGNGKWQDIMAAGQPVVVPMKELIMGGSFWDILPDDAVFNFSVSSNDGFNNLIEDPASHIGLRRVSPARLSGISWKALRKLMPVLARSSKDSTVALPDSLRDLALSNENDPLGEGPVLLQKVLDKQHRLYLSGESNEELRKPGNKRLQAVYEKMRASMGREWETSNVWLSAGGTMSNLQQDGGDNWLCQLSGTKHAFMFSPDYSESLYPVVFNRPGDPDNRQVLRPNGEMQEIPIPMEVRDSKVHAAVKLHDHDVGLFPEFPKAKRVDCRVGPGQCLGIPRHWWHNIISGDGDINLSINFGFGSADSGLSPETVTEMEMMQLQLKTRQHLLQMQGQSKVTGSIRPVQ